MGRWVKKRSLIALPVILTCLAIATAYCLREPTYQGRSMHEWLQQHDNEHQYEALTILGTNNFPLLISLIGYETKSDRILSFCGNLPPWLAHSKGVTQALRRRSVNRTAAANEAETLLEDIGPQAAPAVPQLIQLARENSFEVGERVVHILNWMGEPGFRPLFSLTDHTNQQLVTAAMASLKSHRNSPLLPQSISNAIARTDAYRWDDYTSQLKSR
jgi:hypothetical protein